MDFNVSKLQNMILDPAKNWVGENRVEAMILAAILLAGAYLRLYQIDGYMTFLGDEGRDAIIVRRLLVDFDPILIGPGTSIGNMYLGPLYYYMMAPALLLAGFSPVGPAVMIALLGVVTIWFIWYVTREWFKGQGRSLTVGALIAAGLYAIAPTVIVYSRSSWNPNIMPFFALLTIWSVWKFWTENKLKWLIVAGVAMAFVLQSHYLGLLLVPVVGFFWLLTLLRFLKKKNGKWKMENLSAGRQGGKFVKNSLIALGIFAILMSPLLIFDIRHDWINFSAMKEFFTKRQTTVSARPWTALPDMMPIWMQINERLIAGYNNTLAKLVAYATTIFAFGYLLKKKDQLVNLVKGKKIDKKFAAYLIIFVWVATALVGLGVYKQHIYDHYFGFFFAAPFILIGGVFQQVVDRNKLLGGFLVLALGIPLVISNLQNSPLQYPPNRQHERSVEVSEKMIEESGGEPFNIAVIAERNYEGAYQYHLERVGADFVIIDPQRADDTITDQLFVICELPKKECDPVHNDKAEVANFGWSKIEESWDVFGVTLYRLVHNEEGKPN